MRKCIRNVHGVIFGLRIDVEFLVLCVVYRRMSLSVRLTLLLSVILPDAAANSPIADVWVGATVQSANLFMYTSPLDFERDKYS